MLKSGKGERRGKQSNIWLPNINQNFAKEHNLSNLSISCILRTGQIDDEDPAVIGLSQDGVLQPDGADGVAPTGAVVLERRFGATMSKTLSNLL